MSETANNMIPSDIRAQFPQDEQGRVLFFSTPPVDTRHIVQGRSEREKGDYLAHSLRYLATKADNEREAKRKRPIDDDTEMPTTKPISPGAFAEARDPDGRIRSDPAKAQEIAEHKSQQLAELKNKALLTLARSLNQQTDAMYKADFGPKAEGYKAIDAQRMQAEVKRTETAEAELQNLRDVPDVMTDFKRSPWEGLYKDDFDARY